MENGQTLNGVILPQNYIYILQFGSFYVAFKLNEHAKAQIKRPKFLSKNEWDRKSFYGLELGEMKDYAKVKWNVHFKWKWCNEIDLKRTKKHE